MYPKFIEIDGKPALVNHITIPLQFKGNPPVVQLKFNETDVIITTTPPEAIKKAKIRDHYMGDVKVHKTELTF
jgi:hypothetical protein